MRGDLKKLLRLGGDDTRECHNSTERRQPGPAGQRGTCSGSSAAERPCQRGLRAGSIPAPSTRRTLNQQRRQTVIKDKKSASKKTTAKKAALRRRADLFSGCPCRRIEVPQGEGSRVGQCATPLEMVWGLYLVRGRCRWNQRQKQAICLGPRNSPNGGDRSDQDNAGR